MKGEGSKVEASGIVEGLEGMMGLDSRFRQVYWSEVGWWKSLRERGMGWKIVSGEERR